MKRKSSVTCLRLGLILNIVSIAAAWGQIPGLPEPGLLVYGPVINSATLTPAMPTNVLWQVAGGGDGLSILSKIVVVNGTVYHISRVPFETRTIGSQSLSRTVGTAGLTVSPSTYQRNVTADGLPATIIDSSRNTLSSFTFGASDRGIVERVTLGVATMPIGGGTQTNLVINPDLTVNAAGGLSFGWPAVKGETYTVLRATNALGPFVAITGAIAANPPKNSFSDTKPPEAPVVFYRIKVSP